jgi:hypothetical protein
MQLSAAKAIYDHPGPFASVYLDATRTGPQGEDEVALRWRGLREGLEADGASADLLTLLEKRALTPPSLGGPCTRVLVGAGGEVLLDRVLPGRPARESGTWAPLPDLLGWVRAEDAAVPYVLVEIDREGADLSVLGAADAAPERRETVDGDTENLSKTRGGDWAHRTMQARTEEKWAHNARLVAEHLDRLVREERLPLVAVAGDEHATSLLLDEVSEPVRQRLHRLSTGGRADGTSSGALAEEIARVSADLRRERAEETWGRFEEERGRHEAAVEGLGAVVDALRRAQVETLIVGPDDGLGDLQVQVGADPAVLAVRADDAESLGGEVRPVPADAALLRSAAATDAAVLALPDGHEPPRDGVAALLRYADAATPSA